jgi:tRNA threonylcarbamoyladenosine modification (KEOPS) complex Cgi121 subunit
MVLKHVEEHAKYVEITGFKNVKVEKTEELLKKIRSKSDANVSVQFFNAKLICTWEHIYFAVLNALTMFATKRNISKNLAVEVMLYASAQRQIRKGINFIGVKPSCRNLAVVVIGETPKGVKTTVSAISELFGQQPNEKVLELSIEKVQEIRRAFIITEKELKVVTKKGDAERALIDLVIERMALLSTKL